jgi:hypothetical protein
MMASGAGNDDLDAFVEKWVERNAPRVELRDQSGRLVFHRELLGDYGRARGIEGGLLDARFVHPKCAQATLQEPRCVGCGKGPDDLSEYTSAAHKFNMTPVAYVLAHENTLNRSNGHFRCTDCYIRAGQPRGVAP